MPDRAIQDAQRRSQRTFGDDRENAGFPPLLVDLRPVVERRDEGALVLLVGLEAQSNALVRAQSFAYVAFALSFRQLRKLVTAAAMNVTIVEADDAMSVFSLVSGEGVVG